MDKEILRMQKLAGILTESQYKETLKEGKKDLVKDLSKVFNDISQNKIFVGKDPKFKGMNTVFYDDQDPFYGINEEEAIECLNMIPGISRNPRPISKNPDATPFNSNDLSIIYRILAASIYGIKMGCPSMMNDRDGKYILIRSKNGQGYITHKGEGMGLRQGPKYDLGMGFEFTLL
jgi:hypothetical protein